MKTVGAVIIAYNEEKMLPGCIESVRQVADEIWVVDSFSTDNTASAAKAAGANVVQHTFVDFVSQKNFACSLPGTDYILNLDADERLDDTLCNSILQQKQSEFDADAYSMNRLTFVANKPVYTCGWYPDAKIRLWKKGDAQWVGNRVHEHIALNENATTVQLPGVILHYSFADEKELSKNTMRFAKLAASELQHRSPYNLVAKLLFSPVWRFTKSYFLKKGFTDGALGLAICVEQARETALKYWYAIHLKRNQ